MGKARTARGGSPESKERKVAGKANGQTAALVARVAELETALAAALAPKPRVKDRTGVCECGCGAVVVGRARFQMGHDAKLKSALVQGALAGSQADTDRLALLGWSGFLWAAQDRKAEATRAKLAAAEKKAAADAEREARLAVVAAG